MDPETVLSVSTDAHEAVVRLAGELDVVTGPVVAQAVADLAAAGHDAVVLDLAEVTFLDSSGIGQLIVATGSVASLTLWRPQPRVAKVIGLTGIADLVTLRD